MTREQKNKQKLYVGVERNLTVPPMLNKSSLSWTNYHSGDTGNLLIYFVQRNAFLMAQRWCAQTAKQWYSSVLSFSQTISILLLDYMTLGAKMLRCFGFFSGFLAFYSSDWRVRGKRFSFKCWLGFKPTLYFSHKKQHFLKVFLHRSFSTLIQFSSCTMGNVIMPHLNLITP